MRRGSQALSRPQDARPSRCPGDLKDPAACRDLAGTAVAVLGGVDILVNNAGKQVAQQDITDVTDITDEQFDHTLKTNVYAMFWLTKAAIPHLPAGAKHDQHHLHPGVQPVAHAGGLRHHQGQHQ
jgi:NAD(P)-dependent dehydrogenase (short-subunit alcohol dehydrogenase family)